MINSVKQCRFG